MRNQQLLAAENFAYLKNASMFAEWCAWTEDKLGDLWHSDTFKFCALHMKKNVLPLKNTAQGRDFYDVFRSVNASE